MTCWGSNPRGNWLQATATSDESWANGENPPSTRVAYRLAEESGQEVKEIPPLARSIDPEALDAIFETRSAGDASVTFRHEGYTVTVTGDEDVVVEDVEGQ